MRTRFSISMLAVLLLLSATGASASARHNLRATRLLASKASCPCTITCPSGLPPPGFSGDLGQMNPEDCAAMTAHIPSACTSSCPLPEPKAQALSGGAIAGILVGVLVLLDGAAAGVVYVMRKNKQAADGATTKPQTTAAAGSWTFEEKALAIAGVSVLGMLLVGWGATSVREIGDVLSRDAEGEAVDFYHPTCDPALLSPENCSTAPFSGAALAGIVLGSLLLNAGVMLGVFQLWLGRGGAALPGAAWSPRAKVIAVAGVVVLGLVALIAGATSTREEFEHVSTRSPVQYRPGCLPKGVMDTGNGGGFCSSDPYAAGAKAGIVLGTLALVAGLALAAKLCVGRRAAAQQPPAESRTPPPPIVSIVNPMFASTGAAVAGTAATGPPKQRQPPPAAGVEWLTATDTAGRVYYYNKWNRAQVQYEVPADLL